MRRRQIPSRGPNALNNPIARAVAKANAARVLQDAMRSFLLAIYVLKDGENAHAHVFVSAQVLSVCLIAMAKCGHHEHWSTETIRGALDALDRCARRDYAWLESDARAVDAGLHSLVDIYPQLADSDVAASWKEFRAQNPALEVAV